MAKILSGFCKSLLAFFLIFGQCHEAFAQQKTDDAWLRYEPVRRTPELRQYRQVVALGGSEVLGTARAELQRGFHTMLRQRLTPTGHLSSDAIILGTRSSLARFAPAITIPPNLAEDGFWLKSTSLKGNPVLLVVGGSDRGALYGVFALLRHIALQKPLTKLDELENPAAPIRWTNEWDNLNGTIERGYGGPSIFFEGGNVVSDLSRVRDYARLQASVGINGCSINNVNADARILTGEFLPQLARLADALRPWGIRLSVAVDFASPKKIGGLDTFDPLDPRVAAWWRDKAAEVYRAVPDLGGFLLKADSEGQAGPSAYHRTHTDAANAIARALKPHGGILIYRAFVYNHHLDYNDLKADRARAAYDNFAPLDGRFDDNVVLQIKHGPIDFQVREPVSPLIGALRNTSQALELQITQEYTGQQRHLCFLVPMWKEILDFDLHVDGSTPVRQIVAGKTFHRSVGGLVGVANVGADSDWLGSDLAQANLYGFGRLAWNPQLSPHEIAEEWARLAFGSDPLVLKTLAGMLMQSWPAYENYTGSPLGLQTLTNIVGPHYGPGPDSADGNGWGQWIRADKQGVGMDRTVTTGTGFIGQYSPPVAAMYESLKICPDNLVLFFHHLPYTYVLHSGKTVIQTIYDSHYEGAETVARFVRSWKALRGHVDEPRYQQILAKLEYQAGHAIVWRDAINDWFFTWSGIPDAHGRVGNHPGRVEAESLTLQGYAIQKSDVIGVSNHELVTCAGSSACVAEFQFGGAAGTYNIAVEYFDQNNGVSHFRLRINGKPVADWAADLKLPSPKPDADTAARRTTYNVRLSSGDKLEIEGHPDGAEPAPLDYVEVSPSLNK